MILNQLRLVREIEYMQKLIEANNLCDVCEPLRSVLWNGKTIECTHRMPFSNSCFSHFTFSFPGLVPHVLLMAGSLILVARWGGGWVPTYADRKRTSLGHMGKPPCRECIHARAHIRSTSYKTNWHRNMLYEINDIDIHWVLFFKQCCATITSYEKYDIIYKDGSRKGKILILIINIFSFHIYV